MAEDEEAAEPGVPVPRMATAEGRDVLLAAVSLSQSVFAAAVELHKEALEACEAASTAAVALADLLREKGVLGPEDAERFTAASERVRARRALAPEQLPGGAEQQHAHLQGIVQRFEAWIAQIQQANAPAATPDSAAGAQEGRASSS